MGLSKERSGRMNIKTYADVFLTDDDGFWASLYNVNHFRNEIYELGEAKAFDYNIKTNRVLIYSYGVPHWVEVRGFRPRGAMDFIERTKRKE
jgi:hypothetical protein